MAVGYNPKTVTIGLAFCIDAANVKSYNSSEGTFGQQLFTSTGTSTWTVPNGVTQVSAVVVGAGGGGAGGDSNGNNDEEGGCGGGGGGLSYGTFTVTPGETLTIIIGTGGGGGSAPAGAGSNGGSSQIRRGSTVLLHGGGGGRGTHGIPGSGGGGGPSSGPQRDGGGTGGAGGEATDNTRGDGGGGGGAGGYAGNGGAGASSSTSIGGYGGSGGAGGGGGSDSYPKAGGGGGGGVGLLSQNRSGSGGSPPTPNGGYGGSGGSNGTFGSSFTGVAGNGGNYGGGGGGGAGWNTDEEPGGNGAPGAARIVWGFGRKYPEEAGDASTSSRINNITFSNNRTEATFGKSSYVSDGVSSAFDIDGTYGIVTDNSVFTDSFLQGNWTASFWVKFDTLGASSNNYYTLFTHGTNATRQGLLLSSRYNSGNKLFFGLTSDDLTGNATISTGTWYNIVYTLNNSTYEKQIYLNGSLDASHTGGGAYSGSGSNARFFKILHKTSSNYHTFDGSLGGCSFYERVLTASEIEQNFKALRKRYGI